MSTPERSEGESHLVDLMIAYQGGDLAAFERLYALLSDDVRAYFAAACRDARLVHDLVQDTFLEIHRSRRSYGPPLSVRPWIFGVARNVLARARRAGRYRSLQIPFDGEAEAVLAAPRAMAGADSIDLANAISRLPDSTRDPWLLHHLFGLSFRSIAERLGITVTAAKLRSSRASRALRTALDTDTGRRR